MASSWDEYRQWAASGVSASWYAPYAESVDPSIPMYLDPAAQGWSQVSTPWGETKWVDSTGTEHSLVNPDWMKALDAARFGNAAPVTAQSLGTTGGGNANDAASRGVQEAPDLGSAAFNPSVNSSNVGR